MSDASQISSDVGLGGPQAAEQLLPLIYDELRKLASSRLNRENPGQTLQTTALVHEAYLRLVKSSRDSAWNSRGHFFCAAAEAMRRILIENARRKQSEKGGGGRERVDLAEIEPGCDAPRHDLIALDEALDRLASLDRRKAELVKLRFFAGLTNAQAAEALGISTSTADNDWAYARCWLRLALAEEEEAGPHA